MIKHFYEQMNVKPKLGKNIVLADSPSNIYISEEGEVFCYTGTLEIYEQTQPNAFTSKWYGYKTKTFENKILGFFRITQGCLILDEFLDQTKYKDIKFKKLEHNLYLPYGNKRYFGVSKDWNSVDTEGVTREIFGLTQLELNEVLEAYARTFGLYKRDKIAYLLQTREKNIYPYCTSSNEKDNYCDITDMWIPPTFPYIKFSNNKYSHVSLHGFYKHLASLLLPRLYSDVTVEFQKFIREETFKKFCKIDFKLFDYKKVYRNSI